MTTTELPPSTTLSTRTIGAPSSGGQLADNQGLHKTQRRIVVGTKLPPTNAGSCPRMETSGELNFTSSHRTSEDHKWRAAGELTSPDSQRSGVIHGRTAVGGQTSEGGQCGGVDHERNAALGPILADPVLGLMADAVGDLEVVRVANENRLRTLTAQDEFGHGLTLENKQVAKLAAIVEALAAAEHQAILGLQRSMREHPLGPWVKAQCGVGEKQAARLLAVIRDPYWNDLHDRPRTVSELWAYCGFHVLPGSQGSHDTHGWSAAGSNVHPGGQGPADAQRNCAAGVAPKRTRGQQSNWSEDARKRVWLISASCIKKADSPYRKVYDEARLKYADAVHPSDCVRCGPKGKPALAGSPLSPGHQHARAMRLMSKAILKDLWLEAKRLHEVSA